MFKETDTKTQLSLFDDPKGWFNQFFSLVTSQVNGVTVVTYNGYGGIATKTGVGSYTYGGQYNSDYQLTEVNGPDSLATATGSASRSISYSTPSGRAYYILMDGKLTAFDYDEEGNHVRRRTGTGVNDVWSSLHYVGSRYEYDTVTGDGRLWLDGDAYSAPAALVRSSSGTWSVRYIYRDYLGSITHVTDSTGTVFVSVRGITIGYKLRMFGGGIGKELHLFSALVHDPNVGGYRTVFHLDCVGRIVY